MGARRGQREAAASRARRRHRAGVPSAAGWRCPCISGREEHGRGPLGTHRGFPPEGRRMSRRVNTRTDPIELELFRHLLVSIAEEMGAVLRKTAYSANIKERRDYSCAVYDAAGDTVAMGDHMPVHLGAMPLSVREAMKAVRLGPGDVAILNDPFRG